RPVDRAVDDDPVQPGPEGTAAVEAVERSDRGEESLLRDVLGGGGVMHDEVRGAVGARPVVPEERLQVVDRASLSAPHPGALVALRARHRAGTLRASGASRSMTRTTRPACAQVREAAAPRTG